MFKNYLLELKEIFSSAFQFTKENFKNYMVPIWFLLIGQMIFAIPSLYLIKQYGFINLSLGLKITSIVLFVLYLIFLFIMFKKVFKMVSIGLNKDEISNFKLINGLIALGLFNCTPIIVLCILYYLALVFPQFEQIFKIILNFFTFVFYFAMSLSISSIVKWQEKNVFIAILKSLKVFFKKFKYVVIVFFIIFSLATIISYVICTLIYAFGLYFNLLNMAMVNAIHAIVNICSLYVISTFYIGSQTAILKDENE